MIKKVIIGSFIVFGLLVCGGVWLVEARSTEQGAKKKTESKISANPSKSVQSVSNERLKPKVQKLKLRQVGTPTVQQLLNKVKDNYGKIKDLKADYKMKLIGEEGEFAFLGVMGNLFIQNEKFFFKAPDKLKWIPPNELQTIVIKNNVEYRRIGNGWIFKITEDTPVRATKLYWYSLLNPDRFDFYFRLDEIIEKFDTKVIANPQPNIWVIAAVPKVSNPEDDYNYPLSTMKLQIFVDYEKGVITKIGRNYSERLIQDFRLFNNIWVPTKFVKTRFNTDFTVNTKEEITLSNIQINTGIPDSEFEF